MDVEKGAIFVAFGEKYEKLAFRAAESLREHCPTLEIDLFSSSPISSGPFNRVHILNNIWIRSKLDAMLLSRFEKTLFLDADIRVMADLTDVFEILDRFDFAMAHDQFRNGSRARTEYRNPIPSAFPQLNSGVLGFRNSERVRAFIEMWKAAVKDHGIGRDQPSLRELLWDSGLKLSVLPPEYNLYDLSLIDRMIPERDAAPRVIHTDLFVSRPEPANGIDSLDHYIGRARAYRVSLLLAADRTLAFRSAGQTRLPTRSQLTYLRLLCLLDKTMGRLRRISGGS